MNKNLKELKVILVTEAKNSGDTGRAVVEAGSVFNFDGFSMELSKKEEEFLNSLNHKEFKKIPYDMLDETTSSNFRCYIKRV